MMVYRSKRSQPFRWILALALFIAMMTITFDDVDGFNLPSKPASPDSISAAGPTNKAGETATFQDPPASEGSPTAIPEPTTLLLLAGGLGAMYAVRKYRSK